MPMCQMVVTNTKTGQDHLSVVDPLRGGALSFDGELTPGQPIAGSPTCVPEGLPSLTDFSGDRRIEVLKGRDKYRRVDEDWPVWPRGPPFHCQAVPHGMGHS